MNCAGTCEQEKHVQRHSGRGESVRLEEYQGCHVATADWVRQRMLGQKGQWEVWLEGSFRASKAVMMLLFISQGDGNSPAATGVPGRDRRALQ